jgi:porin
MGIADGLLRGALVTAFAGVMSCAALADTVPAPDAATVGPQPATPPSSLDNLASAVTVRLQYTGEVASNVTGGLREGTTYMNTVDATVRVDADKAFGWQGGRFLFDGFYANASSANRTYVGAFQDPSPIDTEQGDLFRLYQAYYEQKFGDTNVLFGIYDIETEFGVTRPMDVFLNGAYAWNSVLDNSGRNGASTYPNTAPAFRVRQRINSQWSVEAAVLNGVPDSIRHPNSNAISFSSTNGAFLIGEVDYTPIRGTKLMLGFWNYTGKFDAINQSNADGSQRQTFGSRGGYVGGATRVLDQGAGRGIELFATLGIADGRTNEVDGSLNLGATYTGPFDSRPHDKVGIGFGSVKASQAFRQDAISSGASVSHYENNVEATYRAPINEWLVVQPDIQFWTNPGFDATRKRDLMFILHFEVGHLFGL